jgi:GH24 family phage-related lysozyme (muramidase)
MLIMKIDKAGIDFIVKEETGGKDYYEHVYKSTFIWPKGMSGPTAMVGIDIGYYTAQEVDTIFKPLTTTHELELIQNGRGKKGLLAEAYTKKLKGITFTWEEALEVFKLHILPKFTRYTEKAFPGVGQLCPGAQAALVSLVFNRGMSMSGPSRREMAEIKKLVPEKRYADISEQIRHMKRLWEKGSGLIGRRDREAKLVDSCS